MSGENQTQQTQTTQAAPDWTAGLAPELKTVVDAKGFKGPADILAAYTNIEKIVGVDRIPLPKDGVWDDFSREKLGIPKTAAEYKLNKPTMPEGVQWDENFEKAAIPVLHKLGLTPAQANGLLEFYAGHQGATHKQLTEAAATKQLEAQTAHEEAVKALKTEYGQAYDERIALAKRALAHFGGEALAKLANENPAFGSNPDLIRAFAKIGSMMSEETIKSGGKVQGGAMTPAEAMAEATKLMANPAYTTRNHPEHAQYLKRVSDLFAMAHDNGTDVRKGVDVKAA